MKSNGRCRLHGGKTPAKNGWHRPVWPDGKANDATAKTYAKVRELNRRQKKLQARLDAMTPEERAAHERWHRLRPAGSATTRRVASATRQHDRAAAQLFAQAESQARAESAESRALSMERQRLEKRLADLEASIAARDADEHEDVGIFG